MGVIEGSVLEMHRLQITKFVRKDLPCNAVKSPNSRASAKIRNSN